MKTHRELLALGLLILGSACGTAEPLREATTLPCFGLGEHFFSAAEIEKIGRLRERGDSLAAVAGVVGGTRADVKAVERWMRSRGHRPSVGLCAKPAFPQSVIGSRQDRPERGRRAWQ
jgi:hypothetical protein